MGGIGRRPYYITVVCTIGIVGAFAITSIGLVSIGGHLYKKMLVGNEATFKVRTALAYVSERVRNMDAVGCIQLKRKNNRDVLVMEQRNGTEVEETYIYFAEGKLYESLHRMDTRLCESEGKQSSEICEVDSFRMTGQGDGMIQFAAEKEGYEESVVINIRSRR